MGVIMERARILAYITGTVDQELLLRNEYLAVPGPQSPIPCWVGTGG